MNKEDLLEYKKKLSELSEEEKKQRDLYLKRIQLGKIQGPNLEYASIDKPWLKKYSDEAILSSAPEMSLYEYYYNSCKDHLNDIAIDFLGRKFTHEEVLNNICKCQDILIQKGVKKGQVVALAQINAPETIFMIYAINKIGAKISIIDPRANEHLFKEDINGSNPKPTLFIGSETCKNTFDRIKNETSIDDYIFVPPLNSAPNNKIIKYIANFMSKIKGFSKYGADHSYRKLMKKFENKKYSKQDFENFEKNDFQDFDFILHTGGTTGVHKGVELSSNALNNTVYEHKFMMDEVVGRKERFVNLLPQFITYGFTSMHLGLCKGFEVIMLPIPTNKSFVNAIIKNKASIAFGGPIHWEGFSNTKKIKNIDLSFLKVAVAGGEKIPFKIKEKINEVLTNSGSKSLLLDGYGLSETCGVFSVALNDNTVGTVGNPMIYNNVGIFDPETNEELHIGEEGEIRIVGKSMMNDYHNNPKESERVYYNESGTNWFKTGDAGTVNSDGELSMIGRYKRIFVCGVDKVYQETMEELICSLPYIKKCVVVAIPDEKLRNVPKVHIILEEQYRTPEYEKIAIAEIEKLVSERVNKNVVPKYYEFEEKLLYTPNGKVDFKTIQEQDVANLEMEQSKSR